MSGNPEVPSSNLEHVGSPEVISPHEPVQELPVASTDAPIEDTTPAVPASQALRPTTITVGVTAIVLTVFAGLVFDLRTTIGVAIGGLLATVNFLLFIRIVGQFLSQKGASAPWVVLAGLKLLGLFAFLYIVLHNGQLPPLALALGYASLPIGITFGSLRRPRPAEKPSV